MTRSTDGRRLPGSILLRIAPLLFNEHFVSAVVEPTIADLQSEVAAARESRVKRLQARWRGYRSFWMLMLVAPFASWATSESDAGVTSMGLVGRLAVGAAVFALLALAKTVLGVSVAVLAAAGVLAAIVIHAWYERHPSDIPTPIERTWRSPQINFSSTDVGGNAGGLIFVVGTVVILSVGLPLVLWFVLAGTVGGCFLAWRLVDWHARHPKRGLPENLIVLR
jgi:hypothetical protein